MLNCIFCKVETTEKEPVEHIIPESLGNTEHVLRRGVVCGRCNNYFAGKVEKPFQELFPIHALRFHEKIKSKKGRFPSQTGILLPSIEPVELKIEPTDGSIFLPLSAPTVSRLQASKTGSLILPLPGPVPSSEITSRFLAKVALESLATRVEHDEALIAEIVEHAGLEALRNHARRGSPRSWPISVRQIYQSDTLWNDGHSEPYQILHEFDFLQTDHSEIYFVLALFGWEMTINIAGPVIDGFKTWLAENEDRSPLHCGKNGDETEVS